MCKRNVFFLLLLLVTSAQSVSQELDSVALASKIYAPQPTRLKLKQILTPGTEWILMGVMNMKADTFHRQRDAILTIKSSQEVAYLSASDALRFKGSRKMYITSDLADEPIDLRMLGFDSEYLVLEGEYGVKAYWNGKKYFNLWPIRMLWRKL